jgi:hypothetical protein
MLAIAGLLLPTAAARADMIVLHVDSAPNVFGSPNWASWWADTKADVVAADFEDMRTGTHPGTHDADPYDFIVYSTMDLGKRTHWIYWLDGETVAGLDQRFQVKWIVDWDGVDYTYDWGLGALVVDDPNTGWVQPGSWENYSGGVIGSFGFAWWALNEQGGTNVDQDDVDALRDDVLTWQTYLAGYARIRDSVEDPWKTVSIQLTVVPDPATALLLCLGGLAAVTRRR